MSKEHVTTKDALVSSAADPASVLVKEANTPSEWSTLFACHGCQIHLCQDETAQGPHTDEAHIFSNRGVSMKPQDKQPQGNSKTIPSDCGASINDQHMPNGCARNTTTWLKSAKDQDNVAKAKILLPRFFIRCSCCRPKPTASPSLPRFVCMGSLKPCVRILVIDGRSPETKNATPRKKTQNAVSSRKEKTELM